MLSAELKTQFIGVDECLHTANVGERHVERNVYYFKVFFGDEVRKLLHKLNCIKMVVIHLPVATNERATKVNGHWVLLVMQPDPASRQVLDIPKTPRLQ